jgi:hypothetical protein
MELLQFYYSLRDPPPLVDLRPPPA